MGAAIPALAAQAPPPAAAQQARWKTGDRVEVKWGASWWKASVVEAMGEKFKIHYDGYGDNWDEWVTAERIRPLPGAPNAAPEARAPAPAANAAAPRLGKYHVYSYGDVSNPIRMGHFELRADGKYAYYDNGGKLVGQGTYTYSAATSTMVWRSGPFKKYGWGGAFTVTKEGRQHGIRLTRRVNGSSFK